MEAESMNDRLSELRKNFVQVPPLGQLCLAAVIALSVLGLGCAEHHYYRVYDPYYTDYHVWNHDEVVYYNQWSTETHRDPHRDFRKIPPGEQKEYWTWRHNHGDHH
jgi:hypothetical protein